MLLSQQQEVVRRAGVFERVKALAEGSWRKLVGRRVEAIGKDGGNRKALAEEEGARRADLAADREGLILEFRDNLCSLVDAFRYMEAKGGTRNFKEILIEWVIQRIITITLPKNCRMYQQR